MDENKDVQRTDAISRFIDTHTVRVNPFGDNKTGERAYRRAERIVTAIYLLTNHIPVSEPARLMTRTAATKLLPELLGLRDEMRAAHSQGLIQVQSTVRELISLLRILTASGFISVQNTGTMVEALDELASFLISSQRSPLSESVVLSRDEFIDARANYTPVHSQVRIVKDTRVAAVKDSMSLTDASETNRDTASVASQMSVRTQSIMDILKSGGALGIKDICANLPEYSEKMIQRELLSLVSRGQVRKTGLKRWSRYSII